MVRTIDGHKIGIRHGDFHSRRLIESLGLGPNGVIRVSMVHCNTVDKVDPLTAGLDQALRGSNHTPHMHNIGFPLL